MEKHKDKFLPSQYYHVYQRGNNRQAIFFEERNYELFLRKWATHVEPIAETYSFCLLKNHFHILVRIRDIDEILGSLTEAFPVHRIPEIKTNPNRFLSYQFGHALNAYVQTLNHTYPRTSGLFDGTLKRIWIDNEQYYKNVVHYIHQNPQKHGIVSDFRTYPYSSYNHHLALTPTIYMRESIFSMFGNKNLYEDYHLQVVNEREIKQYIYEEDVEN